jgi:DNA (cytosine-5)-methyltransferase 1
MSFNFEPIPYKEIKSGKGEYTTDFQKMLLANARKTDECLGDINYRMRGTNACFTDKIVWDDDVLQTITAGGKIFRGGEQEKISIEDIISASTFPQDYDFGNEHPRYICGMSVPPLMIKRVVERLIESDVLKVKK